MMLESATRVVFIDATESLARVADNFQAASSKNATAPSVTIVVRSFNFFS